MTIVPGRDEAEAFDRLRETPATAAEKELAINWKKWQISGTRSGIPWTYYQG